MIQKLGKIAVAIGIGIGCASCMVEVTDGEGGDDFEADLLEPSESSDELAAWHASQLRVGPTGSTGDEIFARGPVYSGGKWSSTEPLYRVVLGRIAPNELAEKLQVAKQKDILIVLNMAGSRNQWTNAKTVNGETCLMYDVSLYRKRIDEYVGVPGLKEAIAERRVILYAVDEPNIDDFCNSISPSEANAMGLYLKKKWPGAITLIRTSAEILKNGFAGQGPLGPNFWTGIDYGYGLYKGWMKAKLGKTAAQWYPEEKKRMAALNVGMVMGLNTLNHGSWDCWDYMNNGSSWGRVRGQNQADNGGVPCSKGTGGETNWLASPDFMREVVDAAIADPDAPFLVWWTHITPNSKDQVFKPYEVRSDFVNAYKYMISKGRQRAKFNGWRKAK